MRPIHYAVAGLVAASVLLVVPRWTPKSGQSWTPRIRPVQGFQHGLKALSCPVVAVLALRCQWPGRTCRSLARSGAYIEVVVRFPTLVAAIIREWGTHGTHRAAEDGEFHRAIVHVGNSTPHKHIVAMLDAVSAPKRKFASGAAHARLRGAANPKKDAARGWVTVHAARVVCSRIAQASGKDKT
jgi:hypothetical protein